MLNSLSRRLTQTRRGRGRFGQIVEVIEDDRIAPVSLFVLRESKDGVEDQTAEDEACQEL